MNSSSIQFSLRGHAQRRVEESNPQTTTVQDTGRLPRITEMLAMAHWFEEMIRSGEAKDYADVARLTCLCRERVSQIVRLVDLAPEIQLEVLYLQPVRGRAYPVSESAMRKIANTLDWNQQRRQWLEVKRAYRLVSNPAQSVTTMDSPK